LILVFMVDGRRGVKQTWPAALVAGFSFAIAQFVCSNYISVELTDIVAALFSAATLVAFLRVWQPGEPLADEGVGGSRPAIAGAATHDPALEDKVRARDTDAPGPPQGRDSRRRVIEAYLPYGVIIVVFALANGPLKDTLASTIHQFSWPGLNVLTSTGDPVASATFKLDWLPAAGSLLLISGVITMLLLRVKPGVALRAYGHTLNQLKWAIVTVAAVLALAYVMNDSGQTLTIGTWLAGAGSVFAVFSPIIGWLGVSVTGSDTSSNALFGALQVKAANAAGLDQVLMAAANSSGGVLGKMISPQNLAIGAAAVGLGGQEGDLFRSVIKWSLLLLAICVILVVLQSTGVLSWMVP